METAVNVADLIDDESHQSVAAVIRNVVSERVSDYAEALGWPSFVSDDGILRAWDRHSWRQVVNLAGLDLLFELLHDLRVQYARREVA